MHELLNNLIAHMRWADTLVADALDRAGRAAESERLFAHIAAAEHLWYARITGRPATVAVWPTLTVAEARALAAEHADLFAQLIANGGALDRRIDYRNSAGLAFHNTVTEIVTHTAMHGSHHRGQILRLLRADGHQPPYVDYIQFVRQDQQ